MTPDDIRLATFKTTRHGYDTEQVRDLLARAAFALECSMQSMRAMRSTAVEVPDPPAAAAVAPAAAAVPLPVPFDHEALAERLGEVIMAAEELVTWKRRLDGLRHQAAETHPVATVPGFDSIWGGHHLLPTVAAGKQSMMRAADAYETCPAEEWRHGR